MNEMLERTIAQIDVLLDSFYRLKYQQYMIAVLQYQEAMMQEYDREAYSLMLRLTPEQMKEIAESMRRKVESKSRVAC